MVRACLVALAAQATAAPLGAQDEARVPTLEDVARASALVQSWIDTGRIPGAALSVRQHGRVILEASYGWARTHGYGRGQYGVRDGRTVSGLVELAEPVPMTVGTAFDLASVTKVMATTTAVAMLVGRGDLDVGAPVSRYLTDFVGDGKEAITLRHLLTHTSGLRQWVPVYYRASDADEAYAYVRDLPLGWAVGEGRHYSDLGFMLLGRVVERVSGDALDVFLTRELYGPLGLDATGFRGRAAGSVTERSTANGSPSFAATSHGNPFERRMVHDPDFGYRIEGDPDAWQGWREHTLSGEVNDGNAHHAFGGVAGHAGLFSTVAELQVLLGLWMRGGRAHGRSWLAPEVVERFLTPVVDGQALGWQTPDWAPGSFMHTGFTGTFVMGQPASGIGIVLLTNRQNGGVDVETNYPDLSELQRSVVRSLGGTR